MRPTLILGLGGTGTRVAGTVYKYLKKDPSLSSEAEENIKIFAFDTKKYPESVEIQDFVAMQGFDGAQAVEKMLREKDNDLSKWWYKDYRPGFIADGAGQVRINGRLAFAFNIKAQTHNVYTLLERAITRITQLSSVKGTETHKVIDVFIISSIAGGTGSGMIIDVARITRKLVKSRGFNPRIVGVLLDPRVVEGVVSVALHSRIEANGYATLKEIEYWMHPQRVSDDMFKIRYSDSINIGYDEGDAVSLKNDRLFEYILYISDQNEDGRFMESLDSYVALAGQGIYLMTVSELAAAEQSTLDNIINHCEALDDKRGRSRFFGSFGISMLSFPSEKVLRYCSKLLGNEIIEHVLNAPVNQEEIREAVNEFMAANKMRELKADEVIDDLKKPREEISIPSWNPRDAIINSSDYRAALNKADRAADNIVQRFTELVEANLKDKVRAVKSNLDNKISEFLYKKGVRFTVGFIDSLINEIKAHYEDIDGERERIKAILERGRLSEAKGVELGRRISEAYETIFIIRKKRITEAAELYSDWWTHRLENRKNLVVRENVLRFYDEITNYLRSMKDVLDYITSDIVAPIKDELWRTVDLLESVDRGTKRDLESEYVVEMYVLSDKTSVEKFIYAPHKPENIEDITRKFIQGEEEAGIWPLFKQIMQVYSGNTEELHRLRSSSVVSSFRNIMKNYIVQISSAPFEKYVNEMTIEDALLKEAQALLEDKRYDELIDVIGRQEVEKIKRTYKDRPPDDEELLNEVVALRVASAIARSAPFWILSGKSEIGSELNELLLIGYHTIEASKLDSILQKSLEKQSISTWSKVFIGDKDDLLIFRASYGAPFDLLSGVTNRFKSSYDTIKSQSKSKPLHTDRRYETLITDITVHYYLGLAEELGIVDSPEDQESGKFMLKGIREKAIPDEELGEGRLKVVHNIMDEHPEYLLKLQDRVDEEMKSLNALEILELYERARDRLFDLANVFKHNPELYDLLLKESQIFVQYAENFLKENKHIIDVLKERKNK